MPSVILRLKDGRSLRFDRADVPVRKFSYSATSDEVVSLGLENGVTEVFSPLSGPDFLLFDKQSPDRIIAIEIKSHPRRVKESRLDIDALTLSLEKSFAGVNWHRPVKFIRQLWKPNFKNSSLQVFDVSENGEVSPKPAVYNLTNVTWTSNAASDAVLSEPPAETAFDTDYIRRRVQDWRKRVEKLYENIEHWLDEAYPGEFVIDSTGSITMHEDLMQKFAVDPASLPILSAARDGQQLLTLKPFGLWVIGVNGRIDVFANNKTGFLIDAAEPFSEPEWRIFLSPGLKESRSELKNDSVFGMEALRLLVADS